ncbi:MAG: hypothetical protein JWM76_635, partial [Pseudonocardiales bacterium]|nr:hypothetical protein [Pseudonocardiales bacterium]
MSPIRAADPPEFAPQIVHAALTVLRDKAAGPAGRCLADLAEYAEPADLDERVCRSAIALAGSPMRDPFPRRQEGSDPVSLLALAELAPDQLVAVLRDLVPGPPMQSALLLPPGTATPRPEVTPFLMGSAAGAIRILAGTHPELASGLVDTLVLQLGSDEFERFDDHGLREIERALAVMFVLGVGDVSGSMVRAGARGSEILGERLLRVLTVAGDLIAAKPYWREAGDPVPDPARAQAVTDELFEMAMSRIGGDWGIEAIDDAAELVERLAKEEPAAGLAKLAAILGAILRLVDAQRASKVSPLTVVGDDPPVLKMMDAWSNDLLLGRAIGRLGEAVKLGTATNPVAACEAVIDVLTDERDSERGADVAWYLLEVLGGIGASYGAETGVLQAILPVLYTYIVGTDVGTRARAIDSWVAIARRQSLPSTLEDLLPALIADQYIAVIRSVLKAASALSWSPDATAQLLGYAALIVDRISARKHAEVVKDAITATLILSSRLEVDGEGVRQAAESNALDAADSLDAHDLRDMLRHNTFKTAAARSPRMASLRLRQAADPQFAHHSNRRGDSDIEALLACGPGLTSLPAADLMAAATAFGPYSPVAAGEFVEVAWRSGRLAEASTM